MIRLIDANGVYICTVKSQEEAEWVVRTLGFDYWPRIEIVHDEAQEKPKD